MLFPMALFKGYSVIRPLCLGWLLSSLLLLVAACAQPTPLPAASEILTQAAQAMQTLQTVHFRIERSGAPAYIDTANTLIFRRAEGDYATPDQAQAAVRVVAPGVVVEVKIVSLGGDYWETNPLTGEWAKYPGIGYNPALLFDPETGLTKLMREDLQGLTLVGLEENPDFPGTPLFHLTATAPGQPLMALTADMVGRGEVAFDFWIEPETGFVWRLQIVEPETDPEEPTVWVLDFEQFNKAVNITPPIP